MSPLVFSPRVARLSYSRDNGAWIPLSAVLIVAVCTVSSRRLDVDALDGAVKGEGETDEEADANGGSGAGSVVAFCEKSVINEKSRDK
jgi:hypothetical protein